MKTMRFCLPAVVAAFFIFSGCRSTRPVVEIGGYAFLDHGKEYRIESITPNYMEGYNVLYQKEKDELVLKAIDKEQDGTLDEIVKGKLSLEEANGIYQEGLREAERRNYIKKRFFAREYRTSDPLSDYVLATYILAVGEVYNRLTIAQRQFTQNQAVVVDSDADGLLDVIERGPGTLGSYQKMYQQVLDKGMQEKEIVKSGKRYIVVM